MSFVVVLSKSFILLFHIIVSLKNSFRWSTKFVNFTCIIDVFLADDLNLLLSR